MAVRGPYLIVTCDDSNCVASLMIELDESETAKLPVDAEAAIRQPMLRNDWALAGSMTYCPKCREEHCA